MKTVNLVFLIIALAVMANAQNTITDEVEWLLNIPTSPVKITLGERKNHLIFINTTDNEVSEIRLGIVRIENNKYKIVSARSLVQLNDKLPAGQAQFAGIVNYLKDIDSAIEKNAKLTIIMVKFSDGSIWAADANCRSD